LGHDVGIQLLFCHNTIKIILYREILYDSPQDGRLKVSADSCEPPCKGINRSAVGGDGGLGFAPFDAFYFLSVQSNIDLRVKRKGIQKREHPLTSGSGRPSCMAGAQNRETGHK
jgi:hypothetical protein